MISPAFTTRTFVDATNLCEIRMPILFSIHYMMIISVLKTESNLPSRKEGTYILCNSSFDLKEKP